DRSWFLNGAYGHIPYALVEDLRRGLGKPDPDAPAVLEALSGAAFLEETDFNALSDRFPVLQLLPRAQPGLVAYATEGRRGRRMLAALKPVPFADLSVTTRRRLEIFRAGQWPGGGALSDPRGSIQLQFSLAEDQVQLGYTVTGSGVTEQVAPTLRARVPGAPLLVARPETDEL
ncbi:MAG TPA: hypothetical protein VFU47_01370, partial [Armatimonadota bacterium]|nr:hypothetical protein [Armatimonadota bacterium]